jgi:H+/Cl- antiporter ClcA
VTNWIHQSKRKIKDYTFKYALYEVMAISIITTLLSYATRFTRLGNVVFVSHLLNECTQSDGDSALCQYENTTHLLFELAQTFFIKVFLMLITFGIRIPGGVFIPSMVIGATAGRMMGILVQSITRYSLAHLVLLLQISKIIMSLESFREFMPWLEQQELYVELRE